MGEYRRLVKRQAWSTAGKQHSMRPECGTRFRVAHPKSGYGFLEQGLTAKSRLFLFPSLLLFTNFITILFICCLLYSFSELFTYA